MNDQNNKPENNLTNSEGVEASEQNVNETPVSSTNTNQEQSDELNDVSVESNQAKSITPEAPKDKTLLASLKRVTNNGKMRFFLLIGLLVLFIFSYAFYSIIFAEPEVPVDSKSGEFVVPKTNVKAASTVTPEQAEYIKQKQEAEAAEAAKKNDSYIAGFVTEQAASDNGYDSANPTQPGADAQQKNGIDKFFDDKGNVYTLEQAVGLSAQGQRIPGVTIGEGSINDPNVIKANSSNASNGQTPQGYIAPAAVSTVNKPTFNSYVVQPYVSKKTGLNETSNTQVESLERSSQAVDQWSQEYMQLRLKKAQAVEANTQLAFTNQLQNITNAFKQKGDGKTGGSYSSTQYSRQKTEDVRNSTQPNAATSNTSTQSTEASALKKVTARAGETYRTILTSTVNTDEGTEVLARIQSGPYKGETVVGSVKVTENNMQFVFNKILRKNKPEVAINAVARQIGTNSLGMADQIKKHTVQRYTSLVVASALSGVGKAYEQTAGTNATLGQNGTVVTSSTEPSDKRIIGNAVGELGEEISSDIKDVSRRKPTYITNTGKVFNLFLNQDIVESSTGLNK